MIKKGANICKTKLGHSLENKGMVSVIAVQRLESHHCKKSTVQLLSLFDSPLIFVRFTLVLCILESVFQHHKKSNPRITDLYLKSDNAGCYKNQLIISVLFWMIKNLPGLAIINKRGLSNGNKNHTIDSLHVFTSSCCYF